jgi:hypothetical protein
MHAIVASAAISRSLIFACSMACTPGVAQPYVDQFVGNWSNENPQTDGMTRVEINDRLGRLSMHCGGDAIRRTATTGSTLYSL